MDFSKLGFGAIWLYVLFIPMGWGLHIYRRLQRRLSNIDTCQSGLPILLLKARPLNLWAEWHEVAVKHWYTPVWASQSTFWSNTTESVRTVAWGGCQTLTHASLGFPFHFSQQTQNRPCSPDHWDSRNKIRPMYRLVLAFCCYAYLPHTVQMSTWHRHCSDQHCDTAQQKYCPQQWKHPSHQNEPATDVTKIKNKHKNTP